ncbi:alpha/beta hydrolase [Opitutaceae bacterium TAV5]|nr:alpha/beta hydrolase [Opitutaceae bacterium TAV5]
MPPLPMSRVFALTLLLMSTLAATASSVPADTVIVLHGLARHPPSMARIAGSLRAEGYTVRNPGYPSRGATVEELAEQVFGPVFAESAAGGVDPAQDAASGGRIHVVAHSLGCILLRQYIAVHGVPARLGRVVMLAPPNTGSEIVDRLGDWRLFQWINGPAGGQLGTAATGEASIVTRLGPAPAGVEIGVIAGSFSWNPLYSSLIPGDDDGKVAVARTHLDGEAAHLVLPYSHTWLMWRKRTLAAVNAFLRTGRF